MSVHTTRRLSVLVLAAVALVLVPATGARAQTTDLSVDVQAPATVNQNDTYTAKVIVANTGEPSGAQVLVTLPPTETIGSLPSGCSGGGPLATCTILLLGTGQSLEFDFSITATVPGPAPTASTVIPTTGLDTNPTNNVDGVVTIVGGGTIGGTTDLTIDKVADPSPAFVDQDLTYTITIANGSTTDAAAQLTDLTLGAVTFVSVASDGSGDSCSDNSTNGLLVTCTLQPVAAGTTRTITLVVTPTAPLPITNTAAVLPTGALDTNPLDNIKIVVTQVEVATTTAPPTTTPPTTPSAPPSETTSGNTPSGGVQTGGGGTAGGSRLPAVLLGVALASASGLFVLRRRARARG